MQGLHPAVLIPAYMTMHMSSLYVTTMQYVVVRLSKIIMKMTKYPTVYFELKAFTVVPSVSS